MIIKVLKQNKEDFINRFNEINTEFSMYSPNSLKLIWDEKEEMEEVSYRGYTFRLECVTAHIITQYTNENIRILQVTRQTGPGEYRHFTFDESLINALSAYQIHGCEHVTDMDFTLEVVDKGYFGYCFDCLESLSSKFNSAYFNSCLDMLEELMDQACVPYHGIWQYLPVILEAIRCRLRVDIWRPKNQHLALIPGSAEYSSDWVMKYFQGLHNSEQEITEVYIHPVNS